MKKHFLLLTTLATILMLTDSFSIVAQSNVKSKFKDQNIQVNEKVRNEIKVKRENASTTTSSNKLQSRKLELDVDKQVNSSTSKAPKIPFKGNAYEKNKGKLSSINFANLKSETAKSSVKEQLNSYAKEVVAADKEAQVYATKIKNAKEKVDREEKAGTISTSEAFEKRLKIKQAEIRLNILRKHINSERSELKSIR